MPLGNKTPLIIRRYQVYSDNDFTSYRGKYFMFILYFTGLTSLQLFVKRRILEKGWGKNNPICVSYVTQRNPTLGVQKLRSGTQQESYQTQFVNPLCGIPILHAYIYI